MGNFAIFINVFVFDYYSFLRTEFCFLLLEDGGESVLKCNYTQLIPLIESLGNFIDRQKSISMIVKVSIPETLNSSYFEQKSHLNWIFCMCIISILANFLLMSRKVNQDSLLCFQSKSWIHAHKIVDLNYMSC